MKKVLLVLSLFFSLLLDGAIFEIAHFKDVHDYLKPGTVVLLDIDDTLLIPVQMLGCDEWFQSRLRYYQKSGLTPTDCLEKSLAEWEAVRHLTAMEIVEPGTEEHVRRLQQNYAVMGLTTQGLALATRTMLQLNEQHIDLLGSSPSKEDYYLSVGGHGILFRSGILFTSGAHKGKALFGFFDKLDYHPKRIVFVNDKRSHLLAIEETANERGVEFIGLRYGYSDARKTAFDENIAHYQFTHSTLTHLLSDAEAKKQLSY